MKGQNAGSPGRLLGEVEAEMRIDLIHFTPICFNFCSFSNRIRSQNCANFEWLSLEYSYDEAV